LEHFKFNIVYAAGKGSEVRWAERSNTPPFPSHASPAAGLNDQQESCVTLAAAVRRGRAAG